MGEHYEPEDVEEFRTGRWSRGEHKMVTAPDPRSGPKPSQSAPKAETKTKTADVQVTTTPGVEVSVEQTPTADLSGGGKHEAPGS